jgi:hypothetical protein
VDGSFLADRGSDWSLAGSIMTFAIPVGLFVIVATILYFLYTRPHAVPGHRDLVPVGAGVGAGAGAGTVAAASAPPPPVTPAPAASGTVGTPVEETPAADDATEDTE